MEKGEKVLLILLVLMMWSHFATSQVDNQFQYNWLKTQYFDKNIDVKDTLKFNIQRNPNLTLSREGVYLDSGHFMLRAGFNNRYHTTRDRLGLQMLTNAQGGDSTGFIINAKSTTIFQHASNDNPFKFRFQGTPSADVLSLHKDTIVADQPMRVNGGFYDASGNVVQTSQALVGNPPKAEQVAIVTFQEVDINFSTIDPGNSLDETVNISDATTSSAVFVTPVGPVIGGFPSIIIKAYIETDGVVTVRAYNISGTANDPDPMTFLLTILNRQL